MMKTAFHRFAIALIAAGNLAGAAQPAFAQSVFAQSAHSQAPDSLKQVPAVPARDGFCNPSARLIGEINAAYGTRFAAPAGARFPASAQTAISDRGARVAGRART